MRRERADFGIMCGGMTIVRAVFAFVAAASAAWCRAADDESSGDGSEVADYRAHEEALARRPAKSIVDTNTVVRLGYELPDSVVVGAGARQKVYARGILAQCAIGKEKRFELAEGGALAIGSDGFRFDSNYAKGRTNDVVFAGGAIASFEPSFIRSAAPIRLEGKVRVVTRQPLALRASFEGRGAFVKLGGPSPSRGAELWGSSIRAPARRERASSKRARWCSVPPQAGEAP